jgi:hypothetical protein
MLRLVLAAITVVFWYSAATATSVSWPPPTPDLSVTLLTGTHGCVAVDDCSLVVRIENLGRAAYEGPLAIRQTSTRGEVPGHVPTPWTCRKVDYRNIACDLENVRLAPGATIDLLLQINLLPTPARQADLCAALDWTQTGAALRRAALDQVYADLGHGPVIAPAGPEELRSFLGAWGVGDIESANDSDCARLSIGYRSAIDSCPAGQSLINNTCQDLAKLCTGGRVFDTLGNVCTCPSDRPDFAAASRRCEDLAAALVCDGGRSTIDGRCVCPMATPQWNAETRACTTFVAPPVEQSQRVATAQPSQALIAKVKTRRGRLHVNHLVFRTGHGNASRACGLSQILKGDRCLRRVSVQPAAYSHSEHRHRAPSRAQGCVSQPCRKQVVRPCWPFAWFE